MEQLEAEIKHLIIDALKLEDLTVDAIDSEAALFGSGLGLDSLDALEIAMVLSKRYGVHIGPNEEQNRELFRNVRSLARYVAAHRRAQQAIR